MIYDQYGRPLSTSKPIMDEIAVRTVYNKYSTYPSNGLTPERLARIFKEADNGNIQRQMELFEEMEGKDLHLSSILGTRKLAVLGTEYQVMPYSEDPRDKEIATFIEKAFEFEGLENAMLNLLDAIGKGFSACEIMWQITDNKALIKSLDWKHQKKFIYDDYDILKLLTPDAPTEGITIPENKFVIHRYEARTGHPSGQGILRICAWMYLFKNYSVKDWAAFAEVYGMPIRIGKYDPNASEADKKTLFAALESIGSDAYGIISKNTEIELKEAIKNAGGDIYKGLASFCNAEMSKGVLGQTLTTEVGDKGSYAASNTHNSVRQDLKEADCKAFAETLRMYIIKPLVYFNFYDTSRLPWIKFHYEEAEDLEKKSKVYGTLRKDVGLPLPAKHVYEVFGIPEPQPGEQVLMPDTQTPSNNNDVLANKSAIQQYALSANVTDNQTKIDAISDKLVLAASDIFKKLAKPLMALINSASSLEEIKENLAKIYKDMNKDELEELIQRAWFVADMLGRSEVLDGG